MYQTPCEGSQPPHLFSLPCPSVHCFISPPAYPCTRASMPASVKPVPAGLPQPTLLPKPTVLQPTLLRPTLPFSYPLLPDSTSFQPTLLQPTLLRPAMLQPTPSAQAVLLQPYSGLLRYTAPAWTICPSIFSFAHPLPPTLSLCEQDNLPECDRRSFGSTYRCGGSWWRC